MSNLEDNGAVQYAAIDQAAPGDLVEEDAPPVEEFDGVAW